MVIEAMQLKEEKELIYSDVNETRELGCIGHLRGDFGRSGNDFYSKWFPHKCVDLKDEKFTIIFDAIVNKLKWKGNVLASKGEMYNICRKHNEWALTKPYGGLWGFRITTEDYALYVRCSTVRDDYNFYIYCYNIVLQYDNHFSRDEEDYDIDLNSNYTLIMRDNTFYFLERVESAEGASGESEL